MVLWAWANENIAFHSGKIVGKKMISSPTMKEANNFLFPPRLNYDFDYDYFTFLAMTMIKWLL